MDGWVDYFSSYLYGVKVIAMGLAILIFISGIDDLYIDAVYWLRRLWRACTVRHQYPHVSRQTLLQLQEKPLAILVPAWHETGVVGKMTRLAAASIDYENYHIFIGVYPNDAATQRDVEDVCARFPNVHKVVCARPGPTSKADCLNNVLDAVFQFERDACFSFSGFVLHDAEDVISPLELRLFNSLIDRNDLIQLPVYPLERSWKHFTSLSYLDEFSELQGKDVPVREALAGQVPSAGVGTCFSRRAVLALLADGEGRAFDAQSLSEEYDISFRLRKKGMTETFCRVQVVDNVDERKRPFGAQRRRANVVCVREYFPDTFREAVRQKSRWIIGTVFQGFKTHRWTSSWRLNYFLWRDRKSGLVNFLGFGVMLIAIQLGGLWIYEHTVDDAWQFMSILCCDEWFVILLWINLGLMGNRVLQRIIFVTGFYGLRQGLLSIPRLFWGALINFMANCRAVRLVLLYGDPRRVAWDKTRHDFPHTLPRDPALRPLGEILMTHGMISQAQLDEALQQRIPGLKLGGRLLRSGVINVLQLAQALAEQAGVPMERMDCRCLDKRLIAELPSGVARHYAVLPLREEPDKLVLASESLLDPVSLAALARKIGRPVRYVIVPRGEVVVGLRHGYGEAQNTGQFALLSRAAAAGMLSPKRAEALWHEYVSGQILFAEVLITESYLDAAVLKAVLLRYERSDMQFGDFLVQEGVVGQSAVDHALEQQKKLQPSLSGLMHSAGLSSLQISSLIGELT
ncbi:bacteriophage N4 adsorption protein B [Cedecea neteri]|uniref:Bacteriophage N4 adsorption protein B n=1 Tax=Cedecea neteri TaxID=158822 RepID=A0AAN0S6T4_9ENTR|nr:glycosyl transferase family protein [Cedecea neteri]AIR62207.1 bacteriophage N4 adsorption protein B [Cedecea neteri]